jgi:Carboxypeptidase regulatory-like domain
MNERRRRAAVLVLAFCGGCARDDEGGNGGPGRDTGGTTDSADGGVEIVSRTTYTVTPLAQSGRIEGNVLLDGDAPADTTYAVALDAARCGASITVRPVQQRNGALADVVLWLDDVKSGKPLPETRRIELSHERCQFEPRVQAAVAPSTLNVLNDDRSVHTTSLAHVGASKPLVTIPFTDDGQVVPTEAAARTSGVVEARCREHPWATAYVASFDHPYFAVTAADGKFRIDSVPPGRYVLKAWHPRGRQVMSQSVTVTAGGSAAVEAKMEVK